MKHAQVHIRFMPVESIIHTQAFKDLEYQQLLQYKVLDSQLHRQGGRPSSPSDKTNTRSDCAKFG